MPMVEQTGKRRRGYIIQEKSDAKAEINVKKQRMNGADRTRDSRANISSPSQLPINNMAIDLTH